MPVTARTLLQWTSSHLGTTYSASRRKPQAWQLRGYAYSIVCLLIFDRMVLACCRPDCSNHVYKKSGANSSPVRDENKTVEDFCGLLEPYSGEDRINLLRDYHLKFCDFLPLEDFRFPKDRKTCIQYLNGTVQADCAALEDNNKFESIVRRIDCRERYSVKWTCTDCKVAYKEFLCTSQVLKVLLKPTENKSACDTQACIQVLKKCPYFLPGSESQWSGQSVFECRNGEDAKGCVSVSSSKKVTNETINGS